MGRICILASQKTNVSLHASSMMLHLLKKVLIEIQPKKNPWNHDELIWNPRLRLNLKVKTNFISGLWLLTHPPLTPGWCRISVELMFLLATPILSSITAFITFNSLSSWSSTWWWRWWSNQHQHDHHDHHQHQQQHNHLSCFRTVQWCLWQLWATLGNPLHLTLVLTLLLTQKLAIWISAATFTNHLLEHHCVLKQWFCSHWITRTGASDFYNSSTVGWASTKLAAGSLNQAVFTNLGNVGETSSFVKQKCL